MQEEQRSDPNYHADRFDLVLSRTPMLLAAARSNSVRVAYAAYIRDFNLVPTRPFEATRPDGSSTFSDTAADQIGICAEVAPSIDEAVFTKNDAPAFHETKLNQWLNYTNIEWLVICGVWTEACIARPLENESV